MKKQYIFWWHVKDNPETYAHNDSMTVCESCDIDAINEFWNRINNEFDYAARYVDRYEYTITSP